MVDEKNKRNAEESNTGHTVSEQLEVAGEELVSRVKQLVQQGNIRRLTIRSGDGRVLLQIPLTVGVVVGGGLLFFYPLLATLSLIAGLVARVQIEIVREEGGEDVTELDVDTEDVTRKVEKAVGDVGKRLERASSSRSRSAANESELGQRTPGQAEGEDTDNNLQA